MDLKYWIISNGQRLNWIPKTKTQPCGPTYQKRHLQSQLWKFLALLQNYNLISLLKPTNFLFIGDMRWSKKFEYFCKRLCFWVWILLELYLMKEFMVNNRITNKQPLVEKNHTFLFHHIHCLDVERFQMFKILQMKVEDIHIVHVICGIHRWCQILLLQAFQDNHWNGKFVN